MTWVTTNVSQRIVRHLVQLPAPVTFNLSQLAVSVTNDAELNATGASVIIDGNNAVRLFRVSPGVRFIATNLVLINGRYVGTNGAASQDGEAAAGAGIFNLKQPPTLDRGPVFTRHFGRDQTPDGHPSENKTGDPHQ